MKLKLALLFLAGGTLQSMLMEACSTYSSIVPPAVNHNAPLEAGTNEDCEAMCDNLRKLHCPAGDPTPKGVPCEVVCQNVESTGYASENPRCQARAADCAAADACSDE